MMGRSRLAAWLTLAASLTLAAAVHAATAAGAAEDAASVAGAADKAPIPPVAPPGTPALLPLTVDGDEIRAPLGGLAGNAQRGREVFMSRDANCSLCHRLPGGDPRLMGNVGPPLAGVAARLSPAQLRLRIVDFSRIDPRTVMPSYYRVAGLTRVAARYAGRPVLSAGEIEDVIAFLSTLR